MKVKKLLFNQLLGPECPIRLLIAVNVDLFLYPTFVKLCLRITETAKKVFLKLPQWMPEIKELLW